MSERLFVLMEVVDTGAVTKPKGLRMYEPVNKEHTERLWLLPFRLFRLVNGNFIPSPEPEKKEYDCAWCESEATGKPIIRGIVHPICNKHYATTEVKDSTN